MRIISHAYHSKALCLSLHTITLQRLKILFLQLHCSSNRISTCIPSHHPYCQIISWPAPHQPSLLFWSRMPRMLYAWIVFHLEFFMMTVPHLLVPKTLMRSMVGSLVAPCGLRLRPVPSLRGVLICPRHRLLLVSL